ncbi:MAG: hypothetical protein ACFFEU_13570 [Candidatus Thorarchaeota archaeon]
MFAVKLGMCNLKQAVRGKRTLLLAAAILLIMLVVPPLSSSEIISLTPSSTEPSAEKRDETSPTRMKSPDSSHALSEETVEGILSSTQIEQRGYVTTGNQSVRTDVDPDVSDSLPIDDAHNWLGSAANISIADLERLYVANGTFDNGYAGVNENPNGTNSAFPFGWISNSTTSDSQTIQRSAYDVTGTKFIVVENEGKSIGTGTNMRYQHAADTEIMWVQCITNAPFSEDFVVSFKYLYEWGPTDPALGNTICLVAYINRTEIWGVALPSLNETTEKNVWLESGTIDVHIPGASSSLFFEIGLVINNTEQLNPLTYGFVDAALITAQIDSIQMLGPSPPTPSSVGLQFTAGGDSKSIDGPSGSGAASIINVSYWDTNPLPIRIDANVSVSFTYEATLLSHRYTNSYRGPDFSKLGVKYSIDSDASSDLQFYTYLGSLGEYQDPSLIVTYPVDWENMTIYDPGSSDVTSQCVFSEGRTVIPSTVIGVLGWWFFTVQSPNYIKSLETQVYSSSAGQWNAESVFRSGNATRIAVSIGTGTSTPAPLNLVNFTWSLPNGTVWYQESVSGGVAGGINSTGLAFGSSNATAGVWTGSVLWQNNTEVAFSEVQFEVHHFSMLTAADPSIETETGVVVTAFLNYLDAENSDFLMDASATMTANWSASTIDFEPNEGRNQWQADFDTSILPPGLYLVVVNVSRPYFNDASCTFAISSNRTSNTLSLADATKSLDLHQTYSLSMRYEDRNAVGIEGASFSFEIVDGLQDGITWGGVTGGSGGDYSVELYCVYSGDYEISVSAFKDYYESDQDMIIIFVGELNSSLALLNGSAASVQYGDEFELLLEYTNGTGYGLDGADVTVVDPPSNLTIYETQDLNNGLYSITFAPTLSKSFNIVIQARLLNHKTQREIFTLTVIPISSTLELNYTSSIISFDQQCIIYLNLTSNLLGPLAGGEIQVLVNPPFGISLSDYEDLGGGIYRVIATPNKTGIFSLNFLASAVNHADSINAFTLQVVEIGTEVVGTGPLDALYYGRSYSFTYEYRTLSSQIGIDGTSNSTSGIGADWLTLIPLGSGLVNITVVPESVGSYSVIVVIWRSGYQTQAFAFSFLVRAIPITVQMDPPSWTELQPLNLTVTLTDDLGSPVIGAEVQYEVFRGISSIALGEMDEVSDGVYSAIVNQFPDMLQIYEVHVVVSKEDYRTLEDTYQSAIVLLESPEGLLSRLWNYYGIPAVLAFAAVGVVGASYRIHSKRRLAYISRALEVKRRFDDVNNLIGIIILHKTSGLPVYSNILKGGFEEGMISAFITAITHFRSEFDRDDYDIQFEVLPISDIIRAVPTRNLVCAFITVSSASMQQEAKMVEFARGVSRLMDDDSAERPTEVNSTGIMEILERFFDEVMDGFLLRYYKRGKAGAFPKRYRCLDEALNFTEEADCSRPTYVALVMTERCKITEAEASLLVLESIELKLIVPCSKHDMISFAPARPDEGKDLPQGPVRM